MTKADEGKRRWSLLPWYALEQVVDVLEFGARKYGAHNWLTTEPERYREALVRHIAELLKDGFGSRDTDSGQLHLAHVACNALFLLHFESRPL